MKFFDSYFGIFTKMILIYIFVITIMFVIIQCIHEIYPMQQVECIWWT